MFTITSYALLTQYQTERENGDQAAAARIAQQILTVRRDLAPMYAEYVTRAKEARHDGDYTTAQINDEIVGLIGGRLPSFD